jgi:type II secretory pathway component PulJ
MYISSILLVGTIVYIFYLHKKKKELAGKKRELNELQKTIALLQEQILLVDAVRKRMDKLKKEGLGLKGLENWDDDEDGESSDDKEKIIEVLLHAYHEGFYQLSDETKKEIHATREKVERNNFW